MSRLACAFAVLVCCTGCHYASPNSDCQWPQNIPEHGSLRQQAEFAEDLAIRYADARRTSWLANRNQCMAKLFPIVGESHGVTVRQVWESVQHHPPAIDVAEMLSFAPIYACAAWLIAAFLSRRYPRSDEFWDWAAMSAYASLAVSFLGMLAGEAWCLTMENLRIGTGHLSYRTARVPWGHYQFGIFLAGILLFWIVATSQRVTFIPRHGTAQNHSAA
jgi:hypothetical protein